MFFVQPYPNCRAEVAEWRRKHAGRIAHVVGLFDVLHPGHLQLLDSARRLADLTVVSIFPDRQRPVGAFLNAPLQPDAERVEILAALRKVDLATIVPLELISDFARVVDASLLLCRPQSQWRLPPDYPNPPQKPEELTMIPDKNYSSEEIYRTILKIRKRGASETT